jgi:hypothetical protein
MRTNLSFKAIFTFFLLLSAASFSWAQVTISGRVTTAETSVPMQGVAVILTGTTNDLAMTDSDGNYQFIVPSGGTYSVRPFANANLLNGVSTYDLVVIYKHIIGEELLNSPYKIIAADINASGSVSLDDTTALRSIILGIFTELPDGQSWRFVPADYVFPDPQNPFPFPANSSFTNLTANVANVDFLGIKIGDVNNTAIPEPWTFVTNDFFPSKITGFVVFDENENCLPDTGEPALGDWIVAAQTVSGGTYFSSVQNTGAYSIGVPGGVYNVTVFPPNPLWEACDQVVENVAVGTLDTVKVDFPVQQIAECPLLEVDLSTPRLRRCFDNTYNVFYCNKGTAPADDAYIEVEFDPYLSVVGSSIPWSSVNGSTYTFPVGDVAVGECASFNIVVNVSCDAVFGQTHCSEARIYPDTLCFENPLWNGASLEVEAECVGDEVIFTITNNGEAMTEPVNYIVIEDIMVQMTGGNIQLGNGESQTVTIPANGSTWRLELDQVPNHPLNTLVSATIEGCGENGSGTFSLGFVTQFPESDWGGHVDEDCQANVGSYDPNDKQGFPRGVFEEHYIPKGTEIEYLIRFQNTGTDTAFTVRILDTLSQHLDIASIRPGGSSHPYDFKILGSGVAQFLFANIMLPDSFVNEPASNGYVKFSIRPKADLPNMTAVENQAAIYFDFNPPVITNKTLHTLGEQFLNVSTVVFQPGIELEVYPNPASVRATFFIKSATPQEGVLRVFDLQGKLIKVQPFATNTFEMDAAGLSAGLYMFRLESSEGHPIAAGKIIVQRHE